MLSKFKSKIFVCTSGSVRGICVMPRRIAAVAGATSDCDIGNGCNSSIGICLEVSMRSTGDAEKVAALDAMLEQVLETY